jgi:regulatory protein
VPDDAIRTVLDRLTDVGLVNDAAFATAWVASRQAGKGLAPRALAHELRTRGVENAVIAEAVARVDDDDVVAAARSLVRRRVATMHGVDERARLRRLSGMLARKGYPGDVALRVIREVLADDAAGDAAEGGDVPDEQ